MIASDIEKVVNEYISKVPHMSLATVHDNKPWVCEVHFVYDDELNLYFVSKLTTRHSQEIAKNPQVAGNIVKQHSLTEAPLGIYFEGSAEEIVPTEEDIDRYVTHLERDRSQLIEQLKEADGRRMYKITPSNWAVFGDFDGIGHMKHELAWNPMQNATD